MSTTEEDHWTPTHRMVAELRNRGYRVLAPFQPEAKTYAVAVTGAVVQPAVAVIVDTETTGLEDTAEIVQLGLLRVLYDMAERRILSVGKPWVCLEEPSIPISAEAQATHGITMAMVKGRRIADADVVAQLQDARLLIAHHAGFDAPLFARRFMKAIAPMPWACSFVDVDWKGRGYESARLSALLQDHTQQHFAGHDAGRDVAAVAEILATPFQPGTPLMAFKEGETLWEAPSPFAEMLGSARRPRVRLDCRNTPFERKDALKARGYHWNPGAKVWWTETTRDQYADEWAWLSGHVYRTVTETAMQVLVTPVTALTRFL